MTMRCRMLTWVVVLSVSATSASWSGESPEQAKRVEFQKAWVQAAKAEDRKAALGVLAGCKEKASLQLLAGVASQERDSAVRAEAFGMMADFPDEDGSLTGMVLPIFQAQRDAAAKAAMAPMLTKLPLKQPTLGALVGALAPMPLPDLPKGGWVPRAGQVDPTENIEKQRAQYSALLNAISSISGQSFQASKTSTREVQGWWGMHQAEFAKADQDYLKKVKADAEEKKKAEAEAKKADAEAKKTEAETKKPEAEEKK
jgi:hypothetical protein